MEAKFCTLRPNEADACWHNLAPPNSGGSPTSSSLTKKQCVQTTPR